MGSVKAAVLPVPVWAAARTSRPSRTRGMAAAWTGVGWCSPRRRRSAADRPTGRAIRRSSVAPAWIPAVAGGIRGSATAAPACARSREPAVGRPEHSRNRTRDRGGAPRRRAARPHRWCAAAPETTRRTRSGSPMGPLAGTAAVAAILRPGPQAPSPDRQAQQKTRRPPRQDSCHRRVSYSTAATRSPGRGTRLAPRSPRCSIAHRIRPRLASLPSAAPPHRHRAPHAVFRQRGGKDLAGSSNGAQRASIQRSHRVIVVALIAVARRRARRAGSPRSRERPASRSSSSSDPRARARQIPRQRARSTPRIARSYGAS